MLGKLLKYEFKATGRIYLPMIFLVVVLTPITRILTQLDIFNGVLEMIPGMTILAYVLSLIGMGVAAYIVFIYRFYKNLITPEGYLMFTLPVSSHSLVLSKAIVAFFWQVVSTLVVIGSIIGMIYTPELWQSLADEWNKFQYQISMIPNFNFNGFIALIIASIVVSSIYNIFYLYCAVSVGQSMARNKILGSVAAAMVIYIVTQVISTVVMMPFAFNANALEDDITLLGSMASGVICVGILVSAVLAIVYYFISTYFLSKKLNLE